MFRRLLLSLVAIVLLAAPSLAAPNQVLGPAGEILSVRPGWASELPELAGQDDTPLLILEITQADGARSASLVPGTENEDPETSPILLFEAETQRLYLLWEATYARLHSRLYLAWWDGEAWSETVELSGHPFSLKLSPRIVVTRDQAVRDLPEGGTHEIARTVVHVIWWEPEPQEAALYSPVVFVDGVYIGWNPVFYLDELAPALGDAVDPESPAAITPAIRTGESHTSLVIGFVDGTGRPVSTVGVDVIPDLLMSIGAEARSHILEVGSRYLPGDVEGLAAAARSHILEVGIGLSAPARRFLASEAEQHLLGIGVGSGLDELAAISAEARSHILEVGVAVFGAGTTTREPDQRIEITLDADTNHDLGLNLRKIRELPPPSSQGEPTWLLMSADGEELLAAWRSDAEHLSYVESTDDGTWTEPLALTLADQVSLENALELLQDHLDSRH